jgi:polyisoprenoid-binding protein YceI
MRTNSIRAIVTVLCLAPAVVAWRSVSQDLSLRPESKLWIDGTSTVRAFRCAADSIAVRVETVGQGAVTRALAGDKVVKSATVRVPANGLECHNGTMNEHMRKALKTKEFPQIVFRVSAYDVAKSADSLKGSATGELTLGGVTKVIVVTGLTTQDTDGSLRIVGAYDLKMTDFGIKPPSLMLGTMKVGERVKVGFDLVLKENGPTVAAAVPPTR